MPGAYAHITLVNHLREPARLEQIAGFHPDAAMAVMDYFKFCELGAVSPDYPYLAVAQAGAAAWADLMHYSNTGDIVKVGIRAIKAMPEDENRRKALAWLCGYAAHVATDVTIHPVVELKVGPYAQNQKAHRICELHQDAYIFQRLDLGGIGLAEHLNSGIWCCCDVPGSGRIDPAVKNLWLAMLRECHPQPFQANPPDLDRWHKGFRLVVDKIAEEGNKLFPLARHVAVNCGLTYPVPDEIDRQYIDHIRVPGAAGTLHYDQVFDKAIASVMAMWSLIWKGVFDADDGYAAGIGNWNLDTGRDAAQKLAFWS